MLLQKEKGLIVLRYCYFYMPSVVVTMCSVSTQCRKKRMRKTWRIMPTMTSVIRGLATTELHINLFPQITDVYL